MTVAATIGTAPLLAFHFEQVSLASLPANLLAAPAVAPIMWLGMLVGGRRAGLARARRAAERARRAAARATSSAAGARRRRRRPGRWCRCGSASAGVLALACAAPLALAAALRSAAPGAPRGGRACGPAVALAAVALVAAPPSRSPLQRRRSRASAPAPASSSSRSWTIGQGDATLIQRGGAVDPRRHRAAGGPDRAARCARPACGGSTRSSLTHAEADHEGAALPCCARSRRGSCSTAAPAGRPACSARCPRRSRRARTRRVDARAGQRLALGGVDDRGAVAAAAAAGLAADRRPERPRGGRARAAAGPSTCCCPPTRSPTSPPGCGCRGSRR